MKLIKSVKTTLSNNAPKAVVATAVVTAITVVYFTKKSPTTVLVGATADQLNAVLSGAAGIQWLQNGTNVILNLTPEIK